MLAVQAQEGQGSYILLLLISRTYNLQCDERRPSCVNCGKSGVRCSLEFLTPIRLVFREDGDVSSAPCAPCAPGAIHRKLYHKPGKQLRDQFFDPGIDELFHHYINVVAPSLDGNQNPSIWHVSVPQMAIAHPFLLCGITAVSAMHLATLLPHRTKELQTLALVQENAALPSFRASINSPTLESIHATFAFSGSIVYYMMASPADQNADRCRLPSPDDKSPHWFQAMRGLMALFANHRDQLAGGPFAPMLNRDPVSDYKSYNPDMDHLAILDGMFCSDHLYQQTSSASSHFGSSPADTLSLDAQNSKVSTQALGLLRRAFELTHPPNQRLSSEAALRVWPGSISKGFVELIYEKEPRALVILAHYCILLKRNDHTWYVKDLGRGLLKNISQFLSKEWQHWIQWPILEICS